MCRHLGWWLWSIIAPLGEKKDKSHAPAKCLTVRCWGCLFFVVGKLHSSIWRSFWLKNHSATQAVSTRTAQLEPWGLSWFFSVWRWPPQALTQHRGALWTLARLQRALWPWKPVREPCCARRARLGSSARGYLGRRTRCVWSALWSRPKRRQLGVGNQKKCQVCSKSRLQRKSVESLQPWTRSVRKRRRKKTKSTQKTRRKKRKRRTKRHKEWEKGTRGCASSRDHPERITGRVGTLLHHPQEISSGHLSPWAADPHLQRPAIIAAIARRLGCSYVALGQWKTHILCWIEFRAAQGRCVRKAETEDEKLLKKKQRQLKRWWTKRQKPRWKKSQGITGGKRMKKQGQTGPASCGNSRRGSCEKRQFRRPPSQKKGRTGVSGKAPTGTWSAQNGA